MERVNLAEKLSTFTERWSPKIVGELNGQQLKVAKIEGEFVWHAHADEDEGFLCLAGSFDLEFRDRVVTLRPGELVVVPKGVEHRPVAREEAHILLFEPAGVRNTGDLTNDLTVEPDTLDRI